MSHLVLLNRYRSFCHSMIDALAWDNTDKDGIAGKLCNAIETDRLNMSALSKSIHSGDFCAMIDTHALTESPRYTALQQESKTLDDIDMLLQELDNWPPSESSAAKKRAVS